MRLSSSFTTFLVASAVWSSAWAADPKPPVGAPPGGDPIVAKVGDRAVHLSDVKAAAAGLPAELRGVPMSMLYPMLLEQAVDREVLGIEAHKENLQADPKVQQAMTRAGDEVLQNALLSRQVGPMITEDAIHARYDRDYKNKPGEPEVHARHILVGSEDEAKKIIAQLKAGAKFDELAKKSSTDPGAQNGGDLGWFKRGDMVPAFADAAFAMKPGETKPTPVHTQFGWHVIQVEGTRNAPVQSFEEMHDKIRQQLIAEGVKKAVAQAKTGLKIEEYNPDGTPMSAAVKPPTPAPGPSPAAPPAPPPVAKP